MKSHANIAPRSVDDGRRERRKRESFQALAISAAPVANAEPAILVTPAIAEPVEAVPELVPVEPTPKPIELPKKRKTTASLRPLEPAFHEIEEAFFRAGAEPTLQRNEGDEYEVEPKLWQRIFGQKSAT